MRNQKNITKLLKILEINSESNKKSVLSVLQSELVYEKITPENKIYFCSCGYPISCKRDKKYEYILEIINHEVDLRTKKESYHCPKCKRFISENKIE